MPHFEVSKKKINLNRSNLASNRDVSEDDGVKNTGHM